MSGPTLINRRTLNRVIFDKDDGIAVKLYCYRNGRHEQIKIQEVVDLNGEGISILLDRKTAHLKTTEVKKIDILLNERQIGTKAIDKTINHVIYRGRKGILRAALIFDLKQRNRSYYFHPRKLKKVKMGLFKIVEGVNPREILRSILGTGEGYRDHRKSKRLRLAFSDGVTAFLFFEAEIQPIRVDRVADISPNGFSCYVPTIDMFDLSKGKLERVILSYRNDTLTEKKVQKVNITQVEVNGQLLFKISIEFDQEVRSSLPVDSYLSYEDGMARLMDKSVLSKIVQAMVSNAADVQVSIAEDDWTKNKIYRLRYETYLAEGKIKPSDYPDGQIKDVYDEKSLQVYLSIHQNVIAAARNTFDTMYKKLDVENFYTRKRLRQPGLKYVEVSRFCIDNLFRNNINKSMNIILRLFLELYRISLLHGVDVCLITAYKPHINLYKSIGFEPVSEYIYIPKFNFEYVVMSWDLDNRKVCKLMRPFFEKVWHDARSSATREFHGILE